MGTYLCKRRGAPCRISKEVCLKSYTKAIKQKQRVGDTYFMCLGCYKGKRLYEKHGPAKVKIENRLTKGGI